MSLLKVENVSHHFGDKPLYGNASFELYKGEHVGMVGQNGAGKSTFIKILLGEVNHLDAEVKKALQSALIQFKGSIMLVSHEESFYLEWADRIFNIEQGKY